MATLSIRPIHVAVLFLVGGCSTRSASGDRAMVETRCQDGADNDADGLVDCGDDDCASAAACGLAGDAGPSPGVDAGIVDPGPGPMCTDPIDVVFVIDVSTSMTDQLDAIEQGIASIDAAARAIAPSVQFSLVVFVDNVLAVNGCAAFGTIADLQASFREWRAFTASDGQPTGTGPFNVDCPENSLDALHVAATMCPWRAGATHIAIHVTDDGFVERPGVLSEDFLSGQRVEVQHTYMEVVDALRQREIRVGAFAMAEPGTACSAFGTAQGFHTPYLGAPSIPMATGGRVWNINDVRDGRADMAIVINELIAAEHCTLF